MLQLQMIKVLTVTLLFTLLHFTSPLNAQNKGSKTSPSSSKGEVPDRMKRTEWFRNDRFGMFIHFGLYSIPARGEWVMNAENIPVEKYEEYFKGFNPVDYNPREWAKLAKKAGMKYAVMTAKHHDGFCLFDSKLTDYKSTNTQIKRDLIKEFLEAFRAEGLKVGLYYSLIDWHHPEYPKYGDQFHPMRMNPAFKDKKYDFDKYLDYMHGQVKELTTNYGKIDIMWFDFSYGEMTKEKWKAEELVKMVKQNQPQVILNNRLAGDGSDELAGSSLGDFDTPEQGIPDEGKVDQNGNPVPWEACVTLNNSWGYNIYDDDWKSPELIIHSLVNCVSKNGNLLLNVGPDGRGNIPEPSKEILVEVGKWMEKNGSSIYGCGASTITTKPDWGRFTQNGKLLYAHLLHPKIGHINLKGYPDKVKKVIVLNNGTEASTATSWWGAKPNKEDFFINVAAPTYKTFNLPDSRNTVFEIELK